MWKNDIEFKDIELKPDAKLKLFRFRRQGKKQAFTVVEQDGQVYYARKIPETQLLHHLGLGVRAIESLDWPERDKILAERVPLIKDRENKIILRTVGQNIYACVTEVYTPIRDSVVWEITEDVLKAFGVAYIRKTPVKTSTFTMTEYIFKDGNEDIAKGLYIKNSQRGTCSLSLGKYYEIVICSNGLVSGEYATIYSRVHRGAELEILSMFRTRLEEFLRELKPLDVSTALSIPILSSEAEVEKLPFAKKYKQKIKDYLDTEELLAPLTQFHLANAISRIAQEAPPAVRLSMESYAFNLIAAKEAQLSF